MSDPLAALLHEIECAHRRKPKPFPEATAGDIAMARRLHMDGHEDKAARLRAAGVTLAEPGLRAASLAALPLIEGHRSDPYPGGAVDIDHSWGSHWDDRAHVARCRDCTVAASLRRALDLPVIALASEDQPAPQDAGEAGE